MPTQITTIGAARMARRKREAHLKEYVEAILVAVVIAVILRMFVVQAYRVSSGSMENSLQEGDFVFVNKFCYRFAEPQINDVIVFEFPMNTTKDYIKRIVALPGQKVEIRNKQLFVDSQLVVDIGGVSHNDPQNLPEVYSQRDFFGPLTVPANQYFVMGDNRDDSQDSRFWGCLDRSHIKGKAVFIYFSWTPDPNAPTIGPPYVFDLFASFFYNLTHFPSRIRWDRLFDGVS
jgi:signal peptidase I